MKRYSALLVAALVVALLAGAPADAQKPYRVALLLTGAIDDMGWNASAYTGLLAVQKQLGVEVAYAEKLAASDYEEVMRGYAAQGFDLIIGHAFAFGDPAARLQKEFPRTKFIITSSNVAVEPNVTALDNDNLELGFLAGVVAGVVTKTNVVGSVGAMKVPAVTFFQEGFELGARYVNPSVKVLNAITGSFYDAAKAKETAIAMVAQGADVLTHLADRAGLGVIEAAREKKVLAIGNVGDQAPLAPDVIVTSATVDMEKGFIPLVKMAMEGTLKPIAYRMGVRQGVVGLAPFRAFENRLTAEQKARIQQILADIQSGKLDVWKLRGR